MNCLSIEFRKISIDQISDYRRANDFSQSCKRDVDRVVMYMCVIYVAFDRI